MQKSTTDTWAGKVLDGTTVAARKLALDRHNTFDDLADAEYQRWVQGTKGVEDAWAKEMEAKGVNGRALLKDARALLQKYHD